jgi:competence protein ComEC
VRVFLVISAVGFAAGIAVMVAYPSLFWAWSAIATGLALLAGRRAIVWALLLCCLGLGGLRVQRAGVSRYLSADVDKKAAKTAACSIARHLSHRPARVLLQIRDSARRTAFGWRQRAEAIALLRRDGPAIALCGIVELSYPLELTSSLLPNARVLVRARFRSPFGLRNPGNRARTLRVISQRIDARAFVKNNEILMVSAGVSSWTVTLRSRVQRLLDQHIVAKQPRAVISALVLGQRADIAPDRRTALARAGLSHLLAVSGLHLGLLALFVFRSTRWFLVRVPPLAGRYDISSASAVMTLCAATAYTLLTGAAPSTVRALTMVIAFLLAPLFRRPASVPHALALAGLVLLAQDPLNLFRPGFQLSFAAVIGIGLSSKGLFGESASRLWSARQPLERNSARRTPAGRVLEALRYAGRFLVGIFVASTAATLATWPLVSLHFGEVSLAGLWANLVAVPLVTLVLLPLSLLGSLFGLLLGWSSPLQLAAAIADGLLMFADQVSRLPASFISLRLDGLSAVAALLCGAGLLSYRPGRRGRAAQLALLLGLLCVAFAMARPLFRAPVMRVTAIDVGQGDSTLVRFARGGVMLVDAGGRQGRSRFDPGARAVVPTLRALGVAHIDLLVITHPHADHIAGAKAVLESFPVGELWWCWHDEPNRWQTRLMSWARRHGVPIRRPRARRFGEARVTPVWPLASKGCCGRPDLNANDNSIVLRVSYGRSVVLLTGDIERDAEDEILASGRSIRATLLKVPHHGSATSSTRRFLRRVRPELAIISSGAQNRHRLPHRRVLQRYRTLGINVLRTDFFGAISVELTKRGQLSWQRAHTIY